MAADADNRWKALERMRTVPLEVRRLSHAAARGGQFDAVPEKGCGAVFLPLRPAHVNATGREIARPGAAKSSNGGPILSYLRRMETNESRRVRVRHRRCGHDPVTRRQRALAR
jgi:hypothetical protein